MRPGPMLLLASVAIAASSCVPRAETAAPAPLTPGVSPAGSTSPLPGPETIAASPTPASAEPSAAAPAPDHHAEPSPGASLDDESPADTGGTDAPDSTTRPQPTGVGGPAVLRLDPPHELYHRPRATGAVLAAGQDELLARWNVGGTGDPAFVSNQPHYHPGPRVVVDTKILLGNLPKGRGGRHRGVLTQAGVLARARKYGYWPIRLCFEDGLRRDQSLHGKTIVRVTLSRSGKVAAARLVDTDLDDRAVAQCLADEIRDLEFLPAPHRRVDIEISIRLWPGHAPVPLVGPPSDDFEELPGELDVAAARIAIAERSPAIRTCYHQGLARDPKLWGRVQLQVDLDSDGSILKITQTESRFPDPAVARCIIGALSTLRLPKPKGGRLSFVYGIRLGRLPGSE